MLQTDEQTEKRLLDALPVAVVSLDSEARMAPLNHAAEQMMGCVIGQDIPLSRASAEHGHDRTRSILGALARAGAWNGTISFSTPDGRSCGVRAQFARIEAVSADLPAGELKAPEFQDALAIGTLEPNAEWMQIRRRLAEADRCLAAGRMAAGIAHNLNNAMVGVMGYSSMLKGMLEGDPQMSRFIGKVEAAADRAAGLIRQLLSFSQTGESLPVLLSLGDVMEIASKLFIKSDLPHVRLAFEIESGLPLLYGTPADIQQAVNSLFQFVHQLAKGRPLSLCLTCQAVRGGDIPENPTRISEAVRVRILSDCPLPETAQPESLFDIGVPDPNGPASLALPFAKEVLAAHQGWIVARKDEAGCLFFEMYFPSRAALESKEITQNQPSAADAAVVDSEKDIHARRPAKVLAVDDEELVLELVSDLLTQGEFEVVLANGGCEGLQKAVSMQDIDILVLDQSMPDMEGREVYEKLRETRKDLPILVSSGYNTEAMKDLFPVDPQLDFIQKPYRFSQLVQAINRMIA